jgi:hypothetical protein
MESTVSMEQLLYSKARGTRCYIWSEHLRRLEVVGQGLHGMLSVL